jgi:hypothetical protein
LFNINEDAKVTSVRKKNEEHVKNSRGRYLEQTDNYKYIIMDVMFVIKKVEYLFMIMSWSYSNHFILSHISSLLT